MSSAQSHYAILLAEYSNPDAAIALLQQHRPYLELLPSMRRPQESVVTIPLPLARLRTFHPHINAKTTHTKQLPCDLAILMCDPEWKVKMGVEIMIFIHRPHENFSELLTRWRQTQIDLDQEYEWLMPPQNKDMFSDLAEEIKPLFVIFPETPPSVRRGLGGAGLPYVLVQSPPTAVENPQELLSTES